MKFEVSINGYGPSSRAVDAEEYTEAVGKYMRMLESRTGWDILNISWLSMVDFSDVIEVEVTVPHVGPSSIKFYRVYPGGHIFRLDH